MLKKVLLAACLLATSLASNAALIEYNGYSRDTSGVCPISDTDCKYNRVIGGGLEWLKWDVTQGSSINSALSTRAAQGWRLASNLEMASLFNAFQFGPYVFTDIETVSQGHYAPWQAGENSQHNAFIDLFGITHKSACATLPSKQCYLRDDPSAFAGAIYGSDSNGNGQFNVASVRDDSIFVDTVRSYNYDAVATLHDDLWTRTDWNTTRGVALVRVRGSTPPVSVPTPGSIGLLALGLVALGYRRRQVLGR